MEDRNWFENKYIKSCIGGACVAGGIFILFIIGNSLLRGDRIDPNKKYGPNSNYEYPKTIDRDTITEKDVMVLDTMLNQVQDIEKDIDTLHIRIDRIEDKIDELIIDQANDINE
jgi:hypothetical protein